MRLLVTGGSGLIGTYVVQELSVGMDVEVLDVKPYPRNGVVRHDVDILDAGQCRREITGFDAVVHCAGIPHPLNDPPEKVYQTNALGTFNVLEACAANRIKKLVLLSSESTLGFAFSPRRLLPSYFPINEEHPLRPEDPYGLSKATAELLCSGYAVRYGMRIVALRPPWVWVPEERERIVYRGLVREYERWSKNLWAFVHVSDLVDAIRHSLEADLRNPFESFFITADHNWVGVDSRALIEQFFPEVTVVGDLVGTDSLISSRKARQMLGYRPTRAASDLLGS
ncbi:MAG: NAD(P)-dependent oxidoreductase [Ignavibacteria bacterium]|nr:NAD(P)-dependent oxidoreductase [Ignavibacteria bacterium]